MNSGRQTRTYQPSLVDHDFAEGSALIAVVVKDVSKNPYVAGFQLTLQPMDEQRTCRLHSRCDEVAVSEGPHPTSSCGAPQR